jgi:acetyl-CoA hydrolase
MPHTLVNALVNRADTLSNVEIVHILTVGDAPYANPECENHFHLRNLFIGANVRQSVAEGRSDYVPIFLSEIPSLFKSEQLPLDIAMICVSPPDAHGYCSFGIEVGCTKPAAHAAKIVIAEINDRMPRCHGDSFIHISQIDYAVSVSYPLSQLHNEAPSVLHRAIAKNVAELIEDGSTLQMGIGGIPNAVLTFLQEKRNLGIHTEMFSDGLIDLIEQGIVNNEQKNLHTGKTLAGFAMGSQRLYDFMHDNAGIEMHPTDYINDPFIIAQHDRMVAINSALEVDITGQVCADSVGTKFYSGIGGQIDFIRGASRSRGGKAIIALPSTAKNDSISRIVPHLGAGAGVVTTRGDVHYIVTEYGIAYLHGKSIRERVKALMAIAHPNFREALERYAYEHAYLHH